MAATSRRRGAVACALGIAVALLACGQPASPPRASAGPQVTALASGGDRSFATFSQSCALVDGGVQCWGANIEGQIGGAGMSLRVAAPLRVSDVPEPATAVSAGGRFTCAVADGRVYCWGSNRSAQLGNKMGPIGLGPVPVDGLPVPATAVAAGLTHVCAIASERVYCWGSGKYAALGGEPPGRCGHRKRYPCSARPVAVPGVRGSIGGIAAGEDFSCALVSGEVVCWGRNFEAQLGRAGEGYWGPAGAVVGLPGPATALAAGSRHACAVVGGRAYCWGANDDGQLGGDPGKSRLEPARVPGLPGGVTAIALGSRHGCAISGGVVYCWGNGDEGQRGVGEPGPRPNPVRSLPAPATAISAGSDVSCAALETGRVYCFGDNDFGQLGRGDSPSDHPAPVAVMAWDTGRIRDRDGDGIITVSCVGDSNTQRRPEVGTDWCELLAARMPDGWATVNRGRGGATAVDEGSFVRASDQLRYTLENDAPDVVILAFGTNDVFADASPNDIAGAYSMHAAAAAETGALPFIALTPPMRSGGSRNLAPAIEDVNTLLRRVFPPGRIVDFHTGFGDDDLVDRVHANERGHGKRARAAWEALRAASEPGSIP